MPPYDGKTRNVLGGESCCFRLFRLVLSTVFVFLGIMVYFVCGVQRFVHTIMDVEYSDGVYLVVNLDGFVRRLQAETFSPVMCGFQEEPPLNHRLISKGDHPTEDVGAGAVLAEDPSPPGTVRGLCS